jgi:hypothetical protein
MALMFNRKLTEETDIFNLEFPDFKNADLVEGFISQRLNRQDFKTILHQNISVPVYFKKSIGSITHSYCAIVRTIKGVPAQYALLVVNGKRDTPGGVTVNDGKILYASNSFSQFWDYLISELAQLPSNYAPAYKFIDPRLPTKVK